MMNDAKKALAGLEVMLDIINAINARRPDIVEQAAEQVLGVKTDLSDAEFAEIMNKRAEAVTHFDKYPDRVAELEEALVAVREVSVHEICDEITLLCDEVLKK